MPVAASLIQGEAHASARAAEVPKPQPHAHLFMSCHHTSLEASVPHVSHLQICPGHRPSSSALCGTIASSITSYGQFPQLSWMGLEALFWGPRVLTHPLSPVQSHILSSPSVPLPQYQQLLKDHGDVLFLSVSCPKEA